MGGVADSLGGFLGLSDGQKAPASKTGNTGSEVLGQQADYYQNPQSMQMLQKWANGDIDTGRLINEAGSYGPQRSEAVNALATNPLTGTKFATQQVQDNPILGQLFGDKGGLTSQMGILNNLQNQGFQLKPEDITQYGQTSGNIARMFGQAGNQASQSLSDRGLASAPSGAAGAMFSGLQGNQNEQLAQAQQNIMQQRFQNTQNQIAQQQSFISQLGNQGANAINQQYDRQLSGVQAQKQGLGMGASAQNSSNAAENKAAYDAANFENANKPINFMDAFTQGMNNDLAGGVSGMISSMQGGGTGAKAKTQGEMGTSGNTSMNSAGEYSTGNNKMGLGVNTNIFG